MRFLGLFILLICTDLLQAQSSDFESGILPEITITHKVSDRVKLTTKVESMQRIFSSTTDEPFSYSYLRTDIQLFGAYKLNPFWEISAGYQYRFAEAGPDSQRSIQQAGFTQKKSSYRILHRFRTDQTWIKDQASLFRFRYRPTLELPLNGQSIDPGETYCLIADEVLYGFRGKNHGLENRIVISFGKMFSDRSKVETGLDYRADQLLENAQRHDLWLRLAWFYTI